MTLAITAAVGSLFSSNPTTAQNPPPGGVVRWPASEAEGSVNAEGVLVMHGPTDLMHGPSEWRFDGQIDGRGMVTGRLTSFCSYHFVWQKEGT
jgi:hypothetical protein